MENRAVAACQSLGHEAELNERLHADRKQEVINIVNVRKRIYQFVRKHRFFDNTHVVVKKAVKAQIFEAELPVALREHLPVILAQCGRGMTAPDAHFPISVERLFCRV